MPCRGWGECLRPWDQVWASGQSTPLHETGILAQLLPEGLPFKRWGIAPIPGPSEALSQEAGQKVYALGSQTWKALGLKCR